MSETGTFRVKRGLAEMLKGGVIMDVVTPEQASIAEEAGGATVGFGIHVAENRPAHEIIPAREGLGRLERATTPGPDPAGDPSANDQKDPCT